MGDKQSLSLDNQLCFRLYAASRAIQRLYRPALNKLGITYPQYLVLLALWQWQRESPHTRHTLKDICHRLDLDSGTVTPLIDRMVTAKLIHKKVNFKDGRTWHIALTEKAKKMESQAIIIPDSVRCLPGLAKFGEENLARLAATLDQLLTILHSAKTVEIPGETTAYSAQSKL